MSKLKHTEIAPLRSYELIEREATTTAYVNGHDDAGRAEEREHLRDFLYAVRSRLWLVIGITFLTTALVALYLMLQPDLFEAKAQVQVDLETVNTVSGPSKDSAFVVSPVNDPAYFNTQLQILTGARLLRRVVRTLDLENDPGFRLRPPRRSLWQRITGARASGQTSADGNLAVEDRGPLGGSSVTGASPEELAEATRVAPYVEAIQENLKVEPVKEIRLPIKETRLINITFSHANPRVAARIVNAIASTFVIANLEKKTDTNTTTSNILQQRISDLQSQIRTQENQLQEYARNHQILSLDAGQNTVVERLVGLNRQLLEAENERKIAEAAYRSALAPGAADALAEGASRETEEAKNRLTQLWQRRAELLVKNTEEWPEVKEVDNQIAALERQLKGMQDRAASVVLTNLSTRYRQALAREQSLRTAFDQQRNDTLTQNQAAIAYRILQQEIETNKSLLESMLQRSKENEAVLAAMRNNINVNEYAIAPREAVEPRRMLLTSVAFALSLGFGIGLAVLLGHMDDSVRSVTDVKRALDAPTLAAIPSARKGERPLLLPAAGTLTKTNGNGNGHRSPQPKADAPISLTEAYRQLRTAMLLSTGSNAFKSLLVASSVPGEGKTTLAVNTAISFARTGALVLIIDADLRKPRLHKIFDLTNEQGLSTILAPETDEVDILKIIRRHPASGLDVLTSGPTLPDAAELLGSEQMRSTMSALHSIYDYIIIDSSPITYFADGVVLSSLVDGAVMVVSSGQSTREDVRHSYQLLQDAGANIYGVVLNNVEGLKYDYEYYCEQPHD